ncbi:MAG: aldehyde ferredoxin oxidoreductase family protein [Chloroflexi bacterium]|nr:aldehyde ferredoxin oxidoreductase family protein [Chloroflexota bacterium]
MVNGWLGKVILVNLTRGKCAVEELDPALLAKFIGGRGLAVKILFDEVDPTVEPFSEANHLVFMAGPLTGTTAPSGSGCHVVTKSPLTGAIATGRFGGAFGSELKFAGYDGIIFEGKAPRPVYLAINDESVEIRSAEHLWGKDTRETEDAIKAETRAKWQARDTHVACIGPAGEKLVRIASIIAEKHHAAARSGVGAVMGFKNLKAIAVRGTKEIPVADGETFNKVTMSLLQKVKDSAVLASQTTFGTLNAQFHANRRGLMGAYNYRASSFDGVANTNARILREKFLKRGISCFACPVACVRLTEVSGPTHAGKGGGPEFESCTMLGPNCGVDDLAAITRANYLCNELGMDTISVGGTIACAMDMFEHGYLTEEDTGCQLKFGNAEALVALTEKMGRREGFGDILAEGGYRMAEKYGHPEMSMTIKKQELSAWHDQLCQGEGLAEATSSSGGNHQRAEMYNVEVWGLPIKVDPFAIEGKAPIVIERQDYIAAYDSTGLCAFLNQVNIEDDTARLLSSATGVSYTPQDVARIGARIWNLERLFNVKAGFTSKEDMVPRRFLTEPLTAGVGKGILSRLPELLPEYYRLRGWDENGAPSASKLKELALP